MFKGEEKDAAFFLIRVVHYAWYKWERGAKLGGERGKDEEGVRGVVMPRWKAVTKPQQERGVEFQE